MIGLQLEINSCMRFTSIFLHDVQCFRINSRQFQWQSRCIGSAEVDSNGEFTTIAACPACVLTSPARAANYSCRKDIICGLGKVFEQN
eukprot:scaffold41353_cov18-Prasinocladus_malaysianus.AAC.1